MIKKYQHTIAQAADEALASNADQRRLNKCFATHTDLCPSQTTRIPKLDLSKSNLCYRQQILHILDFVCPPTFTNEYMHGLLSEKVERLRV